MLFSTSNYGWDKFLTNCILWNNTSPIGPEIALANTYYPYDSGPSSISVKYCDVQGGENAVYIEQDCTLIWDNSNINVDPLFQYPAAGGYHLTAGSPCIDTGDPTGDYTGQTDIDGEPRVLDGLVDIGADEFSGAIPECPPLPSHEPWSFVHITDPHIGAGEIGFDNRTKLAAAVYEIKKKSPKPEFIVVTGDIADYGCNSDGSCNNHYKAFLEAIRNIDGEIQIYTIPGNHEYADEEDNDCSPELKCYYEYLKEYCLAFKGDIEVNGFQFIGLTTGGYWGKLWKSQIDYLGTFDNCKPKIVLMHHPGVDKDDGSPKDEDFAIGENSDGGIETKKAFLDWCDNANVQLVLSGHSHRSRIYDRNLNSISPDSTTYPQYIQTQALGTSGNIPFFYDGYRIIEIKNGKSYPQEHSEITLYSQIVVSLFSPANVHMYDTYGNHTGSVDFDEVDLDIPNSFYFSHYVVNTEEGEKTFPEQVIVFDPSDDYIYKVVGTQEGSYKLEITSMSGGEETAFEAIDIPTSPVARHVYAVNWAALSAGEEDAVVLEIDADGDGISETTVVADEDLTSDEFTLQTESVIDFEPDTLNLRSPGKVVTAYIELPEGFDVSDIVISSLKLKDSVSALSKPIKIGDYDEDGIPDLMVKFDRQQVAEVLGSGTQMVNLTGQLSDGRPLAGIDFIRVIGSTKAETVEPEFESVVPEEFIADMEENLQTTADTGEEDAFDVEEAVGFMLFEAGEIINELSPESFNNEESSFELACALDDVFTMLDEGMYFEVVVILEGDILERMDGFTNIGEPDEDDWITSLEGQALLYPLVAETIELLESLL